jgi:hypothetical protein
VASKELVFSIVATTIALLSFGGQAWRLWRDRPRLTFYVGPITFKDFPKGSNTRMLQILACNIGYRPLVLMKFAAVGETSTYHMGINDEPSAALGIQDQRFPVLLEPGKTLKFHPIGIEALRRNQTDPGDPAVHHDPYRYFVIVDSFGRFHPMNVDEILWHASLSTRMFRPKGLAKIKEQIRCWRFLRRARARILHPI